MTPPLLAIAPDTPDAAALAVRYRLPVADAARFLLREHRGQLALCETGPGAPGPIAVDLVTGEAAHRQMYGGGRGQPLARAVGLRGGRCPSVVDATAGLGRDGFVLASLGCEVHWLERQPAMAALLADGLRRAQEDPRLSSGAAARLRLTWTDARRHLLALDETTRPQVVYLDPMYPHRDKSALAGKAMRAFRALAGDDDDAPLLLQAALTAATHRVVVKRPRRAPCIDGPPPTMDIRSPNTRYDVYVLRGFGD